MVMWKREMEVMSVFAVMNAMVAVSLDVVLSCRVYMVLMMFRRGVDRRDGSQSFDDVKMKNTRYPAVALIFSECQRWTLLLLEAMRVCTVLQKRSPWLSAVLPGTKKGTIGGKLPPAR